MKKLVLAVLAIGAMAACTKSNVQYEQPGEISLQPVAQKATKAAVDGTKYPTGPAYNFNVWAWWGDYDADTPLASFTPTTPYIAKGTFVHRTETANSWGGQTPYYWPTKGSLVFAGYSPASADGTFNYSLETKTFTVENYIQSNKIDKTVDLMWFDVTDKSYDQNSTDSKGVPVTFQHALSWLTFKFNLKDNNTDSRWIITDVTLKGIEDKATFTAVKGATPEWSPAAKSAEGMDMDVDVVNVYNAGEGTGYTVAYVDGGKVLPGTDVVADGTNAINNAVLVIPQSCAPAVVDADGNVTTAADAELVITYNLKTYIGENNYLNNQTVTLPLNGSPINGNKWEPGKHYIYTITFGANEILIAPSVTKWDEVIVGEDPAADDENDGDTPEITD